MEEGLDTVNHFSTFEVWKLWRWLW